MNGKSVAPDRIKMAAGATEAGRIRKSVAPDGIKMAAGATENRRFGKSEAWHDKRSGGAERTAGNEQIHIPAVPKRGIASERLPKMSKSNFR